MKRLLYRTAAAIAIATVMFPAVVGAAEELPPAEETSDTGDEQILTYGDLIDSGDEKVEARFMGLTGGIILGAEVVMAVEAALKVDKVWPYVTFSLFGAGAGGVGGYFLEKSSPGGAVALFITGIALVIPTAILVGSAFAFDPAEEGTVGSDLEKGPEYSFEQTPDGQTSVPAEEGTTTEVEKRPAGPPPATESPNGQSDGPQANRRPSSSRNHRRASSRASRPPGSLVFVRRDGTTGLSVPQIDIRPTLYGASGTAVKPQTAIRIFVPLLRVDLP